MRIAIGLLLLSACSEPKPVAIAVPPPIEIKAIDAGAPLVVEKDETEDAGAPVAAEGDCKTEPCLVTTNTVDISASSTDLWYTLSTGGGRTGLFRIRRDGGQDSPSLDIRPSHISNVYRMRGDADRLAIATTDGVQVFDKTTMTTKLVPDPKGAHQVAVDGNSIYWVGSDCALKKAVMPAGTVTTLAKTGETYCSLPHLAFDKTDVYFAADSTIYAVSKNGGALRTLVPKANIYILGLEVDDTNAYVFTSPKDSQKGWISRIPKRGGKSTKAQEITVPGNAYTMASDDQRLYWLESHSNKVVVASMTKPDGKRSVLAETEGMAYGISVGSDSVYFVRWVMGGAGSFPEVFRILK